MYVRVRGCLSKSSLPPSTPLLRADKENRTGVAGSSTVDSAEFDKHAEAYEQQLAENIAITGEAPEYFSEYKIAATKALAERSDFHPDVILDFGAGIGNSTPHFRNYFPTSEILSADVSGRSLDILESRFPGVSRRTDMDVSIPLEDNSVDLAFTACVFHHIPPAEHQHWLEEIHRVVRPGGLFVLFEHNPYNPLTVRAVNTCPFDENAILIKPWEMRARLSAAGWDCSGPCFRVFFPKLLASARPLEKYLTWLPLGGQYSLAGRK